METANIQTAETPQSSGFRLRLFHVQVLIEIVALCVTGWMFYNKIAGQPLQCSEIGIINCSVVESSAWSRVLGFPTSGLGFIAHVIILSLLLLERRVSFFQQYAVPMLFGVTLFSVLYHFYLIYISLFVIKAICLWCMTAATLMTIQFGINSVRLRRYLAA